jgi:hypothetical protein
MTILHNIRTRARVEVSTDVHMRTFPNQYASRLELVLSEMDRRVRDALSGHELPRSDYTTAMAYEDAHIILVGPLPYAIDA